MTTLYDHRAVIWDRHRLETTGALGRTEGGDFPVGTDGGDPTGDYRRLAQIRSCFADRFYRFDEFQRSLWADPNSV